MKTRNTVGMIALIIGGVMEAHGTTDQQAYLYPHSRLIESGCSRPIDEILRTFEVGNAHELVEMLESLVPSIRDQLSDPFITESLQFIRYESFDPGKLIADYYSSVFYEYGWKEERSILSLEESNCGGDWLRVFSFDNKQVLVHVCGPMDIAANAAMDTKIVRTITLRFRNTSPEKLFYMDRNTNKRSEPETGAYP